MATKQGKTKTTAKDGEVVKHGYVEKQEVDNNVNLVTPILGGATKEIESGDDNQV